MFKNDNVVQWRKLKLENISKRILSSIDNSPQRVAIQYQETILTYADLGKRIEQYTRTLMDVCDEPIVGQYILLYIDSPLEAVIAHLSALVSCAICVPLDKSAPMSYYSLNRFKNVLCIITDDEETQHTSDCPIIYIPNLEENAQSADFDNNLEYSSLVCEYSHCIMTSGTTGVPKAVMLKQEAIINQVEAKIELLEMNDNSKVCFTMKSSFVASIWQILATIFVGGVLIVLNEQTCKSPYLTLKKAEESEASILCTVPSVLRGFLATNVGERHFRFNNLRTLVLTGELLHSDLVNQFYEVHHGVRLVNAYGQTECSDDTFHYIIPRDFDFRGKPIIPIGYPIPNIEHFVCSDELEKSDDKKGELCIKGVCLAGGYISDDGQMIEIVELSPDLNNKSMVFFTGDLVTYCDDGFYICHGRKDNQIKINGYRLEPEAIEAYCISIEGILDALVYKTEMSSGATLSLMYLCNDGLDVSEQQIRDHLVCRFPSHMIPRTIRKTDSIAYSSNGKKIRNISISHEQEDTITEDEAIDTISKMVLKIFSRTTGHVNSEENNPIDLLDSLQLVSFFVELENIFKIEFEIEKLQAGAFNSLSEVNEYILEKITLEDAND